MALKIELKPNERVMLGDCVVTNTPAHASVIEGTVPILREKDIMSLAPARTPRQSASILPYSSCTRSKQPQDHYALYFRLAREILKAAPSAQPYIESINNRILTGDLYKALKEARKLIAYEKEHPDMHYASKAYAKTAIETAPPRELEASLLLARRPRNCRRFTIPGATSRGLDDARHVQSQALDGVHRRRDARRQQAAGRRSARTSAGSASTSWRETFSLMTKPKPEHLNSIIKINRGIAAGLRGKA